MTLAELFVQFTVKGVDAFTSAIAGVQKELNKVQAQVEKVGQAGAQAFGMLNQHIGGLVRQGLSLSAVGDVLNFRMQQLALTVAGLFGPEIQKAIGLVEKLTGYINSLSQTQKESVAQWIEMAAAGTLFMKLLPLLTGGLGGLLTMFAGVGVGKALVENFDQIKQTATKLIETLTPLMQATSELFSKLVEAALPVVYLIVDLLAPAVDLLTGAIQLLTEALDAGALKWVATALAAVYAYRGFIMVIGVVKTVVMAIRSISAALTVMNTLQAIANALAGNWVAIAGAAAVGVAAFAAMSSIEGHTAEQEQLHRKTSKSRGSREAMMRKVGGPEALDATWQRIARASVNVGTGRKPEEETNTLLERANQRLEEISNNTKGNKPPVDRKG